MSHVDPEQDWRHRLTEWLDKHPADRPYGYKRGKHDPKPIGRNSWRYERQKAILQANDRAVARNREYRRQHPLKAWLRTPLYYFSKRTGAAHRSGRYGPGTYGEAVVLLGGLFVVTVAVLAAIYLSGQGR
jgi:hypothetical protein